MKSEIIRKKSGREMAIFFCVAGQGVQEKNFTGQGREGRVRVKMWGRAKQCVNRNFIRQKINETSMVFP